MKIILLLITLFSYSSFAGVTNNKCNKCGIDEKFIDSLSSSYTPEFELPSIEKTTTSIKQSVKPTLIVFISSSMPRESLKNYTLEASKYENIVFLMRGLVNSSFMSTKDFVLGFEGGIQIQEDAFDNYSISVVPTIVLAKEDERGKLTFDKVQESQWHIQHYFQKLQIDSFLNGFY